MRVMKIKIYLIVICITQGACTMTRNKDLLKKYHAKRNFKKTDEPRGKIAKKKPKKSIFVIQKHDATALHYDFRIEVDGVLPSWAIPKGPSLNPKVKRLAMKTEDHPLEYAKFEGIIPKGEYGAGPVIIWDKGTYRNIKKKDGKLVPMDQCIKNGEIEIFLNGKKLKGGFALVRTHYKKNSWLFIKMKDKYADARRNPESTQPESVKSGKTIKDLKKEAKEQAKKKMKKGGKK